MPEPNLPPEFADAWQRGDDAVRKAIEAFSFPLDSCFLVYDAQYTQTSVGAVGALFVRELLRQGWTRPMFAPHSLREGTLAEALRVPCPTCRQAAYVYCVEWSDNKFDPDWHSDLYALCVACPRVTKLADDFEGSYSRASSSAPKRP